MARNHVPLSSGIVWDNHGCLPLRADASFLPQLERYLKAGVNVVSINVGFADISWAEHVRVLSFMRQWIAQRPDMYRLVSTVEDVRRCKTDGKLGIAFDIEGMCPVEKARVRAECVGQRECQGCIRRAFGVHVQRNGPERPTMSTSTLLTSLFRSEGLGQ
jgi:hypothetical protein